MSEWWTYTLSDFLLFSPRVYYRLFAIHNRALWPAHVLTVALGCATTWLLLWRPARLNSRVIAAVLGILWLWIAWAFFWERYATINWGAPYVAPFFAVEGALLALVGIGPSLVPRADAFRSRTAAAVLVASAVLAYPLIAPLMGRSWSAAEVFGIAPDPTAIATLAALAPLPTRLRWLLLPIPLLWCLLSAATLWTLESGDFFVPLFGAALAVLIALATGRRAGTTALTAPASSR